MAAEQYMKSRMSYSKYVTSILGSSDSQIFRQQRLQVPLFLTTFISDTLTSFPDPTICVTMSRKNLFICFDAFGTLFTPRKPVAQQYSEVARSFGLSGFSDDDIAKSFKNGE